MKYSWHFHYFTDNYWPTHCLQWILPLQQYSHQYLVIYCSILANAWYYPLGVVPYPDCY